MEDQTKGWSFDDVQWPENDESVVVEEEEKPTAHLPEKKHMPDLLDKQGKGEGQLITVAEFSRMPPEGVSQAIVRPASSQASRRQKFSNLQWGSHLETSDDGFFSGVVSVDPVTEPVVTEPVAEEPIAEEPIAEEPIAEEPIAAAPIVTKPMAAAPIVAPKRQETALTVKPERQGTASVLRTVMREIPKTSLEFETKSGVRFQGVSKDVSLNGLDVRSGMDLSYLKEKKQGRLQLVSDSGTHQFFCEVMHVSDSDITLKLFSGDHTFERRAKEKMFEDLRHDHHTLKQEHKGITFSSQQDSGARGRKERNNKT